MKSLLVACLCLLTAGCASMADSMSGLSGLGQVTQHKSSFDGSITVDMSPAWLYDETRSIFDPVPFKLGAQWQNTDPDSVLLVIAFDSSTGANRLYTNFQGVDINIDGQITTHKVIGSTQHERSNYNTVSQSIYTSSSNAVAIPLERLEKMVAAKDTRIRIRSTSGEASAQFSTERIPGGQATAIIPMRTFLANVRAIHPPKTN